MVCAAIACDRAPPEPEVAAPPITPPTAAATEPEPAPAAVVVAPPPVVVPPTPQPHGFAIAKPGAVIHVGGPSTATTFTLPTRGPGIVVAALAREEGLIAIESLVDDIPHCAGTLYEFAGLRLHLRIAEADLLPVTTRRIAVDFGDDTRAELLSGVPLRREGAGWLADPDGLALHVSPPDDAVGTYYDLGDRTFPDAVPVVLGAGDDRLVYDHTHELDEARLEHRYEGASLVATFARSEVGGRTLAEVRATCMALRVVAPSSRLSAGLEASAVAARLFAADDAEAYGMLGVIAPLSGTPKPSWQVARGASMWWQDGTIGGLVERDHTFWIAPATIGERSCFTVDLGGGAAQSVALCFDPTAVSEVPGASVGEPPSMFGRGELGLRAEGELGSELGSVRGGVIGGTPAKKRARVSKGSPKVIGSLDEGEIRRVVHGHVTQAKACYNAGLAKDPTLAGKIVVNFTIDPDGAVKNATIKEDTLADASVGTCVRKAVLGWSFPKPVGGGLVVVSYPFVFATG